jgi:hypothetical protein
MLSFQVNSQEPMDGFVGRGFEDCSTLLPVSGSFRRQFGPDEPRDGSGVTMLRYPHGDSALPSVGQRLLQHPAFPIAPFTSSWLPGQPANLTYDITDHSGGSWDRQTLQPTGQQDNTRITVLDQGIGPDEPFYEVGDPHQVRHKAPVESLQDYIRRIEEKATMVREMTGESWEERSHVPSLLDDITGRPRPLTDIDYVDSHAAICQQDRFRLNADMAPHPAPAETSISFSKEADDAYLWSFPRLDPSFTEVQRGSPTRFQWQNDMF